MIHEIGAGIITDYTEKAYEHYARVDRYGNPYNMSRIIDDGKKLLIPRNLIYVPSHVKDTRVDGDDWVFNSNFKARNAEQEECISKAVSLLKQDENFVFRAPTGWGKTRCALEVIARLGKVALIVVIREDIRDQWIAGAEQQLGLSVGNGIGIIQGKKCITENCGIVIGVINSLSTQGKYPPEVFSKFGLVLWDEVHKVGADHFSNSAFVCPAKRRMGMSASIRKDGKDEVVLAHIGQILVEAKLMPMIPKVIARKTPWKIPMTRRFNPSTGDYEMSPIPHEPGKCMHITKLLAKSKERNQFLCNFILQAYAGGRTLLVQSELIAHLDALQDILIKHIPEADIGRYAQGLKKEERDLVKTKRIIFATYGMSNEAMDIPSLDTLVMATPRSDVEQAVGRVIRFAEGKKQPVIFDPIDETSPVFFGYWKRRRAFYQSKGASIT